MKELIIELSFLPLLLFVFPNASQMDMLPGGLKVDPDFIELYHPQKQYVQLSGVCFSVLRVSLPSIFAARLNTTTLSSMKASFRALYLASQGSSKLFVDKLMSTVSDEGYDSAIEPVLSYDRKKQQFACTLPLTANCRLVSAKPYNESLDHSSDWYGTTEFSARFSIGSSDASVFMCNAVSGARRPLVLFVNTLPTLIELIASIDENTKEVTVRCSGVMSSVFSSVYLWELLIVSPAGNSYHLHEWSNVVYANDKPEPGLMSATLTAVLPTSRIPVAAVTFHCQIVDILGRKFTQRLLPFVLESLMQLPSNIHVGMDKLSPIELLGALPNPPPVMMMPLSTVFRLRCSFDSVAPQLVRIVWESYFFDPRQASYVGRRHSLDYQFILLNESLYNSGHHLCRVWLKDFDPSTSLCSEPLPRPRRSVPLCKNISSDTNVTSLLTDLVAFVPLGESAHAAPSRDLVVQSMTTALIVLSCVSGIFFLCLILMIGRFHCRLRPLVRGDKKQKTATPLLEGAGNGNANGHSQPPPSISRRNSFHDPRSDMNEQGQATAHSNSSNNNTVPLSDPGAENYRGFAPSRPQVFSSQQGSRQPAMTSVACEADFDKPDDEWDNSQAPLVSSSKNNNINDSVVVTSNKLSSPPAPIKENSAPLETPAPVDLVKSSTQNSLTRRASSQVAVNSEKSVPNEGEKFTGDQHQPTSAKSCGTIVV